MLCGMWVCFAEEADGIGQMCVSQTVSGLGECAREKKKRIENLTAHQRIF